MKFLILGHFSYDVFHGADGSERVQAGGLQRAIRHLSGMCARQDRIIPVSCVGVDDHATILEDMGDLQNVDLSALYVQDVPTHRVHYYPGNNGTVVACVKDLSPPIPFDRIKKFIEVDGILVNMMSGVDVRLETLDEIRMAVRGSDTRLHFDFHNLTLGIGPNAERIRRPLPDWRRWAFMMNTVQLNDEEIAGLSVERLTEQQTAGHVLTLSVAGVLVTRGRGGATLYYNEHKKILRKDFPARRDSSHPAVGNGDLFGAAFLWNYCKSGDLFAATESAVGEVAQGAPA
jgi:sugar/nucleoside kinase (ribokinase family)